MRRLVALATIAAGATLMIGAAAVGSDQWRSTAPPAQPPSVAPDDRRADATRSDAGAAGEDDAPAPGTDSTRSPSATRGFDDPQRWPAQIRIETIDVDAAVVPIAVDAAGHMDVPPDGDTVGWYRRGVRPGEPGTATLTAHVDTRVGGPGAFFRLAELGPGSVVELVDRDGTATAWEVVGRAQHDKSDLPTEQLYRRTGTPQLALVTCGGPFDSSERRYRDNVVVYARLIARPDASASTMRAAPTIDAPVTSS